MALFGAQAAEEEHRRLTEGGIMGPDVRYGLLHGRLSAEEKTAALDAFASGETNVLIATTVVEASPCSKHSIVPSHCTMVQCPSRAQSLASCGALRRIQLLPPDHAAAWSCQPKIIKSDSMQLLQVGVDVPEASVIVIVEQSALAWQHCT